MLIRCNSVSLSEREGKGSCVEGIDRSDDVIAGGDDAGGDVGGGDSVVDWEERVGCEADWENCSFVSFATMGAGGSKFGRDREFLLFPFWEFLFPFSSISCGKKPSSQLEPVTSSK